MKGGVWTSAEGGSKLPDHISEGSCEKETKSKGEVMGGKRILRMSRSGYLQSTIGAFDSREPNTILLDFRRRRHRSEG